MRTPATDADAPTAAARAAEALRHVGHGVDGRCGFGTGDGPCPNPPVTTLAAAAAHPDDGEARWLVPAWTRACAWHRDAVDRSLDALAVAELWAARGGDATAHAPVTDPLRRRTAAWLRATPDAHWSAQLGL